MDLKNMSNEELDALLTELVEVKSAKAKAHRKEIAAEVKKRATYRVVDKPVLKARQLKAHLASAKRERETNRKARVKEMSRREAEAKVEREQRKAERKAQAEQEAAEKAAAKAAKAAAKAEVIEIIREDEQPM